MIKACGIIDIHCTGIPLEEKHFEQNKLHSRSQDHHRPICTNIFFDAQNINMNIKFLYNFMISMNRFQLFVQLNFQDVPLSISW